MTYTEYVKSYLEQQEPGNPIYTNVISGAVAADYNIDKKKAAAATSVALKRILDKGYLPDLRCYQKGIYFRTVNTPFGEIGISREKLIAIKYLLPDKGYETGLSLLHNLGLTTQMPAEHLLATNVAKECVRYDSKLGVSICPPKVPVNADNKAYLQILDALDLLDKAPVDAHDPYTILADHIRRNGLKYETLLYYADRYYNRKTIIRLAHTASQKEVKI
ncbi:MAG: hypothetical protein J5569_01405 [Oscillospiraceae bacterium]|nr:hypothetical protein [Oscillospiraceae bacterium]